MKTCADSSIDLLGCKYKCLDDLGYGCKYEGYCLYQRPQEGVKLSYDNWIEDCVCGKKVVVLSNAIIFSHSGKRYLFCSKSCFDDWFGKKEESFGWL